MSQEVVGSIKTSLTGNDLLDYYRYVREGILDAKIPVKKIVGFRITQNSTTSSAIERNINFTESMIQLAINLSKPTVLSLTPVSMAFDTKDIGMYTTNNIAIPILNKKSVDKEIVFLEKDIYLFTTLYPKVRVEIMIMDNSGYVSMEENSRKITSISSHLENRYFPMNTYHSIKHLIKVLPFDGKSIRYTFPSHVSSERIENIITNYCLMGGFYA